MSNRSRPYLSRRRFLQLSAASSLAACAPWRHSAEVDAGAGESVDVAIIGAGLSGLVAARELTRAGIERVRVFEARERVGGRTVNQAVAGGAAVVEAGGQWVGPTQTEILALVDELGLSTFPTYDVGDAVVHVSGIRLTGRGDFLEPDERADRDRAVTALEAMARTVPLAAPWTAPRAAEWDAMTVADWLDGAVTTAGARFDLEGAVGSTLSASPIEISLLYFLFYVASAGGYHVLVDIAGGAQERRITGGSQLISLRLAEQLGAAVQLETPVAAIHHTDAGATVELVDGARVDARRVIVAMMPADARRIRFSPPLPPARAALMAAWRASAGYKAHLVYDRPFWRDAGLSGQAFTDGIIEATFDNSPPSGTPGILVVFADPSRLPADPTMRRTALAEALVPLFGAATRTPIEALEMDWGTDAISAGCVSPLPPRLLTDHGPAIRVPVGCVHWAGTETAEVWSGYMDGAVRAGKRAAAEVIAEL